MNTEGSTETCAACCDFSSYTATIIYFVTVGLK